MIPPLGDFADWFDKSWRIVATVVGGVGLVLIFVLAQAWPKWRDNRVADREAKRKADDADATARNAERDSNFNRFWDQQKIINDQRDTDLKAVKSENQAMKAYYEAALTAHEQRQESMRQEFDKRLDDLRREYDKKIDAVREAHAECEQQNAALEERVKYLEGAKHG